MGLWLALGQASFAALALWRLGGRVQGGSVLLPLLAISLQAGAGSFLAGFAHGREQLYADRTLPLVHVSPAPAVSLLLAQVGAELPRRAWSALLLSAALSTALPAGTKLWGVPLLWLTAMVAGALGQMAGLLCLVAWVGTAPRALSAAFAVALALQVGLLGCLAYLVAAGRTAGAVAGWLQAQRGWLVAGLVTLLGAPGAAMGLRLLRAPGRLSAAYRDGWLNLRELADAAARPRRSRLPLLLPGGAGAVQAKDWVLAARNPFSRLRLAVWGAGLVALTLVGPSLARVASPRRDLLLLGFGLGLTQVCFAELIGALFSGEGPRFALYVLAGVRPARLLAGKLLAALPYAVLTAVSAGVAGTAAGSGAWDRLRLALTGAGIGLGMAMVMVGASALGATGQDEAESPASEALAAAFEQLPRGAGAWAGLLGGLLFGVLAVLATAGMIAPSPVLAAILAASPPLCLVSGYLRLRRLLANGG